LVDVAEEKKVLIGREFQDKASRQDGQDVSGFAGSS
jgi:hypothetical protein